MRRGLTALAVVAGLALVAAVVAWNSLDLIVAWTLEHYGPEVMGVDVKVRQVRISARDGRGEVRGLELGSPPGFTAPRAARFGEIRLAIDPATILDPVVRVREVFVDTPTIVYERGPKGANLEAIQANIDRYVGAKAGGGPARGDAGPAPVSDSGAIPGARKRLFIIDRLVIKGARVTMSNAGLRGQGLAFDLPDVEIRDIGKREGGVTASQVASIVAGTLQNRIAQRLLTNLDSLRRGGVEGAIDALKGLLR